MKKKPTAVRLVVPAEFQSIIEDHARNSKMSVRQLIKKLTNMAIDFGWVKTTGDAK